MPRTARLTVATTAGWQAFIGITYLIAPRLWLTPLVPQGADRFLDVGATLLVLSSAWQLADGIAMAYAEALRAAGDTTFSLWARVAINWLVFVPGALVTTRIFGARELGAAAWLVVSLGLLALVMVLRFSSGKWRSIELVEPELVESGDAVGEKPQPPA